MDVDHQVERHYCAQAQQWPHLDAQAERSRIRDALLSGNAWLHPHRGAPACGQMDLFAEAA